MAASRSTRRIYIYELPFSVLNDISIILDTNNKWKELGKTRRLLVLKLCAWKRVNAGKWHKLSLICMAVPNITGSCKTLFSLYFIKLINLITHQNMYRLGPNKIVSKMEMSEFLIKSWPEGDVCTALCSYY